jgi:hypothetical protein
MPACLRGAGVGKRVHPARCTREGAVGATPSMVVSVAAPVSDLLARDFRLGGTSTLRDQYQLALGFGGRYACRRGVRRLWETVDPRLASIAGEEWRPPEWWMVRAIGGSRKRAEGRLHPVASRNSRRRTGAGRRWEAGRPARMADRAPRPCRPRLPSPPAPIARPRVRLTRKASEELDPARLVIGGDRPDVADPHLAAWTTTGRGQNRERKLSVRKRIPCLLRMVGRISSSGVEGLGIHCDNTSPAR